MEQKRLENEQLTLIENNTLLIKLKEELESSLYQCAINHTYATEPYLCGCGCGALFDKPAITNWLSRKKTCPISRRHITFENLTLDRMRKNKVEDLLKTILQLNTTIEHNKINIEKYTQLLECKIVSNLDYISYNKEINGDYTYYQITTNETKHIHQTIYFLVDTSYSMNSLIQIKNSEINCNLSYLDLVKHSLGVFCKLLENNLNVEICIIKFSSSSTVIFEPQFITSTNIESINTKIGNLIADGQTNIYSAFLKSFDYIKKSNNYSNIVLLTDGIPTKEYTPNGLDTHIFKSLVKHNLLDKISINTIGLGYNLEIESLLNLSSQTNGSYFYMPESSLVGPTIIHLLINLTTKCCKSVNIELYYENNLYIDKIIKNLDLFNYTIENNKLTIHLGSMNESQQLVVKINNIIEPINVKCVINTNSEILEIKEDKKNSINIEENNLRLDTMCKLYTIYKKLLGNINYYNCNDAKTELDMLISSIQTIYIDNTYNTYNRYNIDFCEDITKQIYMGLTNKEYFDKWGKYFIPSIIHFHNKKICPNFIQPGLQHYKTQKMADLAEDYQEIFCTYEPPKSKPKPTLTNNTIYRSYNPSNNPSNSPSYNSTPSTQNLEIYRTISSAGCFHGDSLVKISNNETVRVSDLHKNMTITDSEGNPAIIECVVTFPCNNSACLSEFPNGLKITPYHPVKIDNAWKFPIDIVGAKNIPCNKVYNFVLNTRKSIVVNNIVCCTLGHNIQGPVIEHRFFGTDNVITNLKTKFRNGYDNGLIDNITRVIRSPVNNNIIGYE